MKKLYYWWLREGKYLHKTFYNGVKNLIKWFPIIWKDRNWDDFYIFEILKFKLKNQAQYIGSRDIHVAAKRDAEKMMLCVKLIDKIQDEYYCCEYQKYQKSEFSFLEKKDNPKLFELDIKVIEDNLDEYFKKYPLSYKKAMQSYTRDSRTGQALSLGHYMHNKARKLLFKVLENNIEGWWD